MERRVLLAVVLSMAVLYAYQAFLAPPPPDPKTAPQQQSATAQQPESSASPAVPANGVAAAPAPQALVGDTAERDIVIETADVEAVISNRGGRIVHWRLKRYLDDEG